MVLLFAKVYLLIDDCRGEVITYGNVNDGWHTVLCCDVGILCCAVMWVYCAVLCCGYTVL